MIDRQNTAPQSESFQNLYQDDVSIKQRDPGHSSLASILRPRPSHLPLGGTRTIEFLGFRTGKNRFGRNTISFDFIDSGTEQIITRTVNIDPTLSDRSYFTKLTSQLIGDSKEFQKAAQQGGDALGTLINEQRGRRYTAEVEPSKTGMHTNIIDFQPVEATDKPTMKKYSMGPSVRGR